MSVLLTPLSPCRLSASLHTAGDSSQVLLRILVDVRHAPACRPALLRGVLVPNEVYVFVTGAVCDENRVPVIGQKKEVNPPPVSSTSPWLALDRSIRIFLVPNNTTIDKQCIAAPHPYPQTTRGTIQQQPEHTTHDTAQGTRRVYGRCRRTPQVRTHIQVRVTYTWCTYLCEHEPCHRPTSAALLIFLNPRPSGMAWTRRTHGTAGGTEQAYVSTTVGCHVQVT